MNPCGCNAIFLCLTHRFEGRIGTGNSADVDLMAQNDMIDYLPVPTKAMKPGKTCKDNDLPRLVPDADKEMTEAGSCKEDDIECDAHVKMEGEHIGKIVGHFYDKDTPHLTKAEKIERDILDELSSLRQKVADLETAKAFQSQIFDNVTERLGGVEDHLRIMDRILSGIDLQGNG